MSKIHLSICSLPWRRQKRFGISGDVREPLGRRRGGILLEDNTTKALGLMVPAPTVLKQIKAATGVEWVVVVGGGRACPAHRRELKMELAWFWDVCLFVCCGCFALISVRGGFDFGVNVFFFFFFFFFELALCLFFHGPFRS
jgi:hypothetical protein